jgi:hypothetical protein
MRIRKWPWTYTANIVLGCALLSELGFAISRSADPEKVGEGIGK